MPEQPPDPVHYDMKIPPEPADSTLRKQENEKASAENNNVPRQTDKPQAEQDRK